VITPSLRRRPAGRTVLLALALATILPAGSLGARALPVEAGTAARALTTARVSASTWRLFETAAGSFNAVSCPTTEDCVAVATSTGSDNAVTFDGSTWRGPRLLEQYVGELVSLSCPAAGSCVALTDLGMATILRDGRWSSLTAIDEQPGPPYPGMMASVSCTSARFCVAVDAEGNAEAYEGRSWTRPSTIDGDYR
jgi:hypothetical protein